MSRPPTTRIAAALSLILAASCANPTDTPLFTDRPPPQGDGTVARMALPGSPEGIAVAPEGFAYVTQPDHGASPGRVARVDLSTRSPRRFRSAWYPRS